MVTDELSYNPGAFELRRNGEVVELEPQAISLAAYLIENRDRLISKEELLDEVWGDRFVSESALTTRIKQIRRGLGDDGSEQRVVKTIYGKGYRFIGDIAIEATAARTTTPDGTDQSESVPHNLPRLRNGIVGRESDLTAVAESIGRHRLTTLVGVGGVGKTTLAVATGHALLASFPHGTWFVDLVGVDDGDQLPTALASAAGLSLRDGPILEQVINISKRREMLFILDNCEHVIGEVAALVDALLDSTTAPRFLLTSRVPSGLSDEVRVVVGPLSPVASDGPAVQLLVDCVARFGVTDVDRARAREVCQELDGLPLAIELAAAQLRHLSLDDLAARLDRRFDLLVNPQHDRHPSLTAVLDSTWSSISSDERELLCQLAASPSPLALDDLIEIMDEPEHRTIAVLGGLVDCSLLTRSVGPDGTYAMLETVREYARKDDVDRAHERRDRLADWCLERVGNDLVDHSFDFGLVRWCRTHEAVLDSSEAHLSADRPRDAALLVSAQGLTLHVDDGSRAANVLGRIDRHLDSVDDPGLRARLHITGTFGAMAVRNPSLMASHAEAAVREARRAADPSALAIGLVLESWSFIRHPAQAIALVTEAAQVADSADDGRSFDLAEGYRAWHLAMMRDYDQAIEVARKVLERSPVGAGYDTACAVAALASCLAPNDPATALEVFDSHLAGSDFAAMMANRLLLASIHAASGKVVPSTQIIASTCRRLESAGQHAFPDALVPVAMLAAALGDEQRARIYVSAVRQSDRPTQSLQITCLYQQLRSRFSDADDISDLSSNSDDVAAEALAWLDSLAGASGQGPP